MDQRTNYGRKICADPLLRDFDEALKEKGHLCCFLFAETDEGREFWANLYEDSPNYASAIAALRARAYVGG